MTNLQIIETGVIVAVYFILRILIYRSIDKIGTKNSTTKTRSKIVKKVVNLTLLSIVTAVLFSIFGVDRSEIVLFIGSLLTVVGIAFFAQWSILANITSGVIIFFNHTVKLDDTLTILDKDYEIEGRISDIGLFFVILKTKDDEQISIPNSLFLQKMIKKTTINK